VINLRRDGTAAHWRCLPRKKLCSGASSACAMSARRMNQLFRAVVEALDTLRAPAAARDQ
jgi:hypothetical protein